MLPDTVRADFKKISEIIRLSGLVSCNSGNLSVRSGGGSYLITRSGEDLRFLKKGSFVRKGLADKNRGDASIEWRMHAGILREIKGANSVLHFQSPFLTALSVGKEAPLRELSSLLPESAKYIGEVAVVGYHPPGSGGLAAAVLKTAKRGMSCMILKDHGGLALGSSVWEALNRAEVMEFTAKVLWLKKVRHD